MKTLITTILIFLGIKILWCQNPITYSPNLPGNNIITDVVEINDTLYTLQVDIGNDYFSNLIFINLASGEIINSYPISNLSFLSSRIINTRSDSVFILGRVKTDTCSSYVISGCFNLKTKEFNIISEIPFCESTIQNLRIQNGLENEWLINGYWVNNGYRRFILKMDNKYRLTLIMDSIVVKMATIDFSRKGYLIKDESFCTFYDKDFNFRKDRYRILEGINNLHQTNMPFDDHLILESFSGSPDFENTGHHIRIIDSSLHVIKQLYIQPGMDDYMGGFEPPFFGGVDYLSEDTVWIAGNNNLSGDLTKPTHFSITQVNGNLEIQCNQYIGFDAYYRIYGLRATPDGGVIVYGMKYNDTYDPYIIKLGPNCELPTVSTKHSNQPMISISAYPNPGSNSLTFTIHGFDPAVLDVEFIDILGRPLFKIHDLNQTIEVPDLAAGQYFYRILQDDKVLGVGSWVKN